MRATFTDHPGEDLLESGADVLVNPVNCVGVSGKGLALEFARRWPGVDHLYLQALREKKAPPPVALRWGSVAAVRDVDAASPWVILFPTKLHWRDRSTLAQVRKTLPSLAEWLRGDELLQSIAIPALGCGLGGLDWAGVRPLIVEALADLPLRVMLYPPHEVAP